MDEHYCFFAEKHVDWDSVYNIYSRQINYGMNNEQLFEVLTNMLSSVRDGHVNLVTSWDQGRYWSWHEKYYRNYSDSLITRYLGNDYRITNGLKYRILDDNIGYVRCSTFQNEFGAGNLDEIMLHFIACRGLIIDIRQNGGGMITSAEELASRFVNEDTPVGYIRHKTGKGHNDFSSLEEQILRPANGVRWQKKVVVITNRSVFSAANEFVKFMKQAPKTTILGDQTGGGAGMPFSSELPNGWSVRFSACPMYDINKNSTEDGIQPDIKCMMSALDFQQGKDTCIERARSIIASPN
jgi:C-terminal processing protease CtpA/Prc